MLSQRHNRAPSSEPASVDIRSLLDNVIASLGDALVLTDASGRIVLFNPAAEELSGFSEGYALGRHCEDVFAATPAVGELVRRTRQSLQNQACGEERLTCGGRHVLVRLSCSPVRERTGELVGCALVMHDLSYQKKLEDEARRNETLAQLGGLVAGLAHEVKNPLGGIRGAAQLLAERYAKQPDITQFTGLMIREVDRLSQLVQELLTLGAPPKPDPQPLNVHKLIREVIALVTPELAAKKITVRLRIDPSLPDTPGDETQLVHLFLNLAKNAVEAMSDGGMLTIATRVETDFHIRRPGAPARFLCVEVEDTGPGFPNGTAERVFEPFYTTKPRGTGLGLAICQRIVAAHGGDIRAENAVRGGAKISVDLPLLS